MLLLLPLIFNTIAAVPWEPDLRIVGGYPILITSRPFHVVLYRVRQREAVPDCGGSIIDRRWVLTAAHCIHGLGPRQLYIRAGIDDLDDDDLKSWYEVSMVVPHERFDPASDRAQNDIGLLKTRLNFEYSPTIQPINLSSRSPQRGDEAIISGFGVTQEGGLLMSKILRAVSVTVLDRYNCRDLLEQVSDDLSISETHFCAAYLEGGRDACQGDSGGPVTIGDSLAGVVSWGIGCAHEMVPAFYTDVSVFRMWLKKKMRPKTSMMIQNVRDTSYEIE